MAFIIGWVLISRVIMWFYEDTPIEGPLAPAQQQGWLPPFYLHVGGVMTQERLDPQGFGVEPLANKLLT